MTGSLTLEEFGGSRPAQGAGADRPMSRDDVDAAERAAYERGYAAGWDDAVKAEQETHAHISAELARNLQDLGFTFHEARMHVMHSIEPFLHELLAKFLPALAQEAVGPMVQEVLMPMVEEATDMPIDLAVPVGSADLVAPFVAEVTAVPVRVVEEPSLTDGQAILRSGRIETRIDLSEATERIIQAFQDLYAQTRRNEPNERPGRRETGAI